MRRSTLLWLLVIVFSFLQPAVVGLTYESKVSSGLLPVPVGSRLAWVLRPLPMIFSNSSTVSSRAPTRPSTLWSLLFDISFSFPHLVVLRRDAPARHSIAAA